ncbi:minimal binding motif of hap4 for binding to hap2/3/5 domain-containing protein [Trichoderma breve]|uniref:Minimal binding motif of hap4 for binding to hap2/3/5 domain-containing protein n=1 Tax=Trichoderma breve TaxID=2034170 RepID=A0A9W9EBQ4_9HYPO|nr:minimal binding motif of hap4 for binding to hap2/3/5 domain-containing protein [Trichoderma breve]KAJ4863719.1 minimal binding motif of hap4 for binding to hap2/3/5 domain-containing protein [Trichoderma breve]
MASISPTSSPHLQSRSLDIRTTKEDLHSIKVEPSPPEASSAPRKRAPLPSQPKSAAPPQAPFPQPKMSMTSKEWVIPPRPKPGRKPATDTPPTKRKAQNRAAQRAFRERRAARVGELEEMLDEHKKTQDNREKELTDKIHSLELDVQSFRSRCLLLESMLERERQERMRAEMQAETLSRRYEQATFRSDSLPSMPHQSYNRQQHHQPPQQRHSLSDNLSDSRLAQQQSTARHFSISQIVTPPETMDAHSPHDLSETHLTCGSCSPNGHCACAEEVLASVVSGCGKCGFGTTCQCLDDTAKIASHVPDLKRPISPSGGASQEKRQRSMAAASRETDFSSFFTRTTQLPPPQPSSIMSQPLSTDFRDSCGFCKDGTYCVCADTAMATPAMTPADASPPVTRQTRTPPPMESDVVTPLPPMTATASRGSCGPNGPGTCAQCQADPKSGLFCRLMAASFNREQGASADGCCGGKGAGGGCCKSKPSQEKVTLPSVASLGLSCAEAYQTLSSHRNFEQAADEIGSWLPKLKAHPAGDPRVTQTGRIPIEVEAASIMSVLKEFDIRFGREC